ncbi:MAG: SDR family NAD(P)-dependent oxidoreductase [Candidatus Bathyarchaeota archaeon]|nr:SDR family NAD(P)-dependent oxidoreductase [Candidatus Bathyarchaeota archaeon]
MAKAMGQVLVTGGAGFIGSHVVDRLVREGYSVRIIDDLSSGKMENINSHLASGKATLIKGDIRDESFIRENLQAADAVLHFAAMISVPLSVVNPELTFDINLRGTLNLLKASIEAKVKRFVFISSCAVCGEPVSLPVTELAHPNPISPYAESKLLGERYCLGFKEREMLQSVVLRFFNVYGPRQGLNDYSGVITRFVDRITRKEPLVIYGDGSQTRDFVNVKDVAEAVYLAMTCEDAVGQIFNIGSGKATSIKELATTLLELSGEDLPINYFPARAGDIKDSYADISKANLHLGYAPQVSLKTGLRTLLEAGSMVD